MEKNPSNIVGAVETALEILNAIKEMDAPGVSDIAKCMDMPVSTTHNHLATLERKEYVVKKDGAYYLSYRLLELGGYRRSQSELVKHGQQEVIRLAEETGDLVNLVVEEHGRAVHLYLAQGDKAVQVDSFPGMRSYLHTTASGKALLAHLPTEKVDAVLDRHGMVQRTENTITQRDELYKELDEIKETGIAFDEQERLPGLNCVAAPILIEEKNALGAVSVSAPASRLEGQRLEETLPKRVKSTADVISINVTY